MHKPVCQGSESSADLLTRPNRSPVFSVLPLCSFSVILTKSDLETTVPQLDIKLTSGHWPWRVVMEDSSQRIDSCCLQIRMDLVMVKSQAFTLFWFQVDVRSLLFWCVELGATVPRAEPVALVEHAVLVGAAAAVAGAGDAEDADRQPWNHINTWLDISVSLSFDRTFQLLTYDIISTLPWSTLFHPNTQGLL